MLYLSTIKRTVYNKRLTNNYKFIKEDILLRFVFLGAIQLNLRAGNTLINGRHLLPAS